MEPVRARVHMSFTSAASRVMSPAGITPDISSWRRVCGSSNSAGSPTTTTGIFFRRRRVSALRCSSSSQLRSVRKRLRMMSTPLRPNRSSRSDIRSPGNTWATLLFSASHSRKGSGSAGGSRWWRNSWVQPSVRPTGGKKGLKTRPWEEQVVRQARSRPSLPRANTPLTSFSAQRTASSSWSS